jgi:hypothetical protein
MWLDDYLYEMDQRIRNLPVYRERFIFREILGWEGQLLLLPGLRGTGKSVLLMQLKRELEARGIPSNLIWVDEAQLFFNKDLREIISALEEHQGQVLENFEGYLLFDEVHYDPKWAEILKIVHDRAPHLKIVATGSSMLDLLSSPDLLRRATVKRIWPLTYVEWLFLQGMPVSPLSFDDVIAGQANAPVVPGFENFLHEGGFPFLLSGEGALSGVIERVINVDLPRLGNFDSKTLLLAPRVLTSLAQASDISLERISREVGLSKPVVHSLVNAFERAGLIFQLSPYGASAASIRKGYKRFFSSPCLRAAYLHRNHLDILTEDYVAAQFFKYSRETNQELSFWSGAGPDLILGSELAIEISMGVKTARQVRVALAEGISKAIVISKIKEYKREDGVLHVPLSLFTMIG